MPRPLATADVFSAIAEPRRREIVELLAEYGERDVTDLVDRLGLPQPTVSKHLGVLREVGVVSVTKDGRRRVYRLNAAELKPVHDWVKVFERFWASQLDRIKERAERFARERAAAGTSGKSKHKDEEKRP